MKRVVEALLTLLTVVVWAIAAGSFYLLFEQRAHGAEPTWDYLGDAPRPARLADCPGAKATVSYSSGEELGWQRFCYYGVRPTPGSGPRGGKRNDPSPGRRPSRS